MTQSAKNQVRAANAAFYAAFREGSMEAMEALWSRREAISVFHPNVRGIEGRNAVMRSWNTILAEATPPDIAPVEISLILSGKTAMTICEEWLGTARMIATNIFADEDGVWRMVHHQATRLPATPDAGRETDTGKGRGETG